MLITIIVLAAGILAAISLFVALHDPRASKTTGPVTKVTLPNPIAAANRSGSLTMHQYKVKQRNRAANKVARQSRQINRSR